MIWVANRRQPIYGNNGTLSMTINGSLLIADGNSSVIWLYASTATVVNPVARLLDTGNLIVTKDNDTDNILWQSFDYPTDTLIPGMKLGWDKKTGLNRNITSWASPTDPSPGTCTVAVDLRGDPQLILWVDSVRKWRSGPWNGITPYNDPNAYVTFSFIFVNTEEEVSYTVNVVNNVTLSRLVVDPSGNGERYVLSDPGQWTIFWHIAEIGCDSFGVCGPNGICYTQALPMCGCLPGFKPRSPELWSRGHHSEGCIRTTGLDCINNGTDRFVTVQRTLMPDTVHAVLHRTMHLDDCMAECLRNCSCTGYASADIYGNGCIIWFMDLMDVFMFPKGGQEFYLRLAAADPALLQSENKPDKKSETTIAITVSLVGSLLLTCIGCCIWRKKRRTRRGKWSEYNHIEDEDIKLPLYDLDTVISATNHFANKLGEGGFGPVYKGKLQGGQEIAVKRLSKTSNQGVNEFKNEVLLIAKLQHRNLVRLLGCCTYGKERMLIYEYMPNKSLDALLFDKAGSVNLDWPARYLIITGIARGLLYLHQDSRFRIVHRDLKASNILLDKDMNPKISDFGLARIFGSEEAATKTRRVVGTYGYMSPEYAMDGIFSAKSDVFSFGVLVLEIVSGQRNKGVFLYDPYANLLGKAWWLWNEGKSMELVDPSISSDISVDEALRCIKVGLLCVQEKPEARPTMSSVVLMLSNQADASFYEPQKPGYAARKDHTYLWHSSSSNRDSGSINDISVSLNEGR